MRTTDVRILADKGGGQTDRRTDGRTDREADGA